jgi:hypothetical protein
VYGPEGGRKDGLKGSQEGEWVAAGMSESEWIPTREARRLQAGGHEEVRQMANDRVVYFACCTM